MTSAEYRAIIATIIRQSLRKYYPGLAIKRGVINDNDDITTYLARTIHARMYGANVDGVDSPIWHNTMNHDRPEPTIEAKDLLK